MVKSFIRGSASKLAKSTEERCKMSWLGCHEGDSEADAQAWPESVKEDRYLSDVFKQGRNAWSQLSQILGAGSMPRSPAAYMLWGRKWLKLG
jgi:hypothetical protein